MVIQAKQFALLVVAMCVIAVALVGCQVSGAAGGSGTGSTYVISTPNTASNSPTPTFPPFTVGAWPSNYSPNNNDNITIYVICRVQNQSMTGPAQPPSSSLSVRVVIGSPVNQNYSGATDADGLAAIPITFNDPSAGQPVTVDAYVTYSGVTYHAATFFTPSPNAPTPTAGPKGTPGATPGVTPTPGTGG
ncbi:MAG TPA: hypothetical protein VMV29_16305 [Ktedonobacterales bacterium]|nr:hypothetical protein [Ktedonobacterales bacterium]